MIQKKWKLTLRQLGPILRWLKKYFGPFWNKKVELALEEVLVNIIQHGYQQRPGLVEIEMKQISDDQIEIVITDEGLPFDPTKGQKKPHLSAPIEELPIGGLGIPFLLQCLDEVKYTRKEGLNILMLTIRSSQKQ